MMEPIEAWVLSWHVADRGPETLLAGEKFPDNLSVSGSAGDTLALFEGYLFDGEDLKHDLNLPQHSSNADIVRSGYTQQGDRLLASLRGGFVFAFWDATQRKLVIARDPIGLHPCYYFWDGRCFLLSSSLDAILAQPQVSTDFNTPVVAEHLLGAPSLHQRTQTFYDQVNRLPPAHRLCIRQNNLHQLRYWDPVPPGFQWASEKELAEFGPLLERAVSRCISVGADSIALSGGFDSVSLAVLAADQLRGKKPLQALSLRFVEPQCDEGPTQVEVARALGMPLLIRTLEESVGGKPALDAALELSVDSPSPVLSIWQSFYTGLFGSAPQNLRHLLLGTGGDDLLTVDLRYAADCLATLKFGKLWRFLRSCQRSSPFSAAVVARVVLWDNAAKPEARDLLLRLLGQVSMRAHDWLDARPRKYARHLILEDLAATLDARRESAPSIELAPGERSYVGAIRGILQAPLLMQEFEQGFAWAQRLGFTLLLPYFDKDLFAILLRADPEHLLAGGKAKAPLRHLVAERLPVTLPTKKVDFSQVVHAMLRPRCAIRWQALRGRKILADLGISSAERLDLVVRRYAEGESQNHHLVWRILSTETWLRERANSGITKRKFKELEGCCG